MKFFINQQVSELLIIEDVIVFMCEVFVYVVEGVYQGCVCISVVNGVMLLMMGVVIFLVGIVGVKVYIIIKGQFKFVIQLFFSEMGVLLCIFEGDVMIGLCIVVVMVVVCDVLVCKDVVILVVIGIGVQVCLYILVLLQVWLFKEVLIVGLLGCEVLVEEVMCILGVLVWVVSVDEVVVVVDVLVIVIWLVMLLFDGKLLCLGIFVVVVGVFKVNVCELDDIVIGCVVVLFVEWKLQVQQEVGDLVQCVLGVFDWDKVMELVQVVDGSMFYQCQDEDIVIYKVIGIGLEDVVLVGLVYCKVCVQYGW